MDRQPAAAAPHGRTDRTTHWDTVYETRGAHGISWYQREPSTSLELFDALGATPDTAVIDIGGGASTLVDHLVARSFRDVTVLDLSASALDLARTRIGPAPAVTWVAADVLRWQPPRPYGLWHDRAVFHFFVDDADRAAYLTTLRAAVPTGAVVLATFAPDGPDSCSGLPVARYGPDELADLLDGFDVLEVRRHIHHTPSGAEQPFTFVAARAARAGSED